MVGPVTFSFPKNETRSKRSTLVEQTTPTGHLLFDTSALARHLDFLDIDVDRDLDFKKKTLGSPSGKG